MYFKFGQAIHQKIQKKFKEINWAFDLPAELAPELKIKNRADWLKDIYIFEYCRSNYLDAYFRSFF